MRPPARRPPIKPYDRGSDGPLKQVAILHLVPGLGLDRFRKALLPRFQNPEIEETGAAACRVERPHPELVFARSWNLETPSALGGVLSTARDDEASQGR